MRVTARNWAASGPDMMSFSLVRSNADHCNMLTCSSHYIWTSVPFREQRSLSKSRAPPRRRLCQLEYFAAERASNVCVQWCLLRGRPRVATRKYRSPPRFLDILTRAILQGTIVGSPERLFIIYVHIFIVLQAISSELQLLEAIQKSRNTRTFWIIIDRIDVNTVSIYFCISTTSTYHHPHSLQLLSQ